MNNWSKWYKFSELYEYYGPIINSGKINKIRKMFSYNNTEGNLHEDDGFRLRSKEKFSYDKIPLKVSLEDLPCPLRNTVVWGCYWLRIKPNNQTKINYNYIGQSTDSANGLRKRLTSHFREICDLPSDPNINIEWKDIRGLNKPRDKFKLASETIRKYWGNHSDPNKLFFDESVSIKFIEVNKRKPEDAIKEVHRIEGMALAAYKNLYGEFPNLNDRNETRGLNGLFD